MLWIRIPRYLANLKNDSKLYNFDGSLQTNTKKEIELVILWIVANIYT
jgi:hypothetical protein